MGRQEQATGKLCLLDRHGMSSGFMFQTFLICQLLHLSIIRCQNIIADGRFFRRRTADLQLCRVCRSGIAAAVNKRFKQGTTTQQADQHQ